VVVQRRTEENGVDDGVNDGVNDGDRASFG
jgi:hypothetical protein